MTRKSKTWNVHWRTVAAFGLIWVAAAGPAHARGGYEYAPHPAGSPTLVAEHRSGEVPREFERQHPCPSTGATSGACPGYVRDHIVPLCAGGADATWNMQWQTTADARAKDVAERQACRRQR